MNKNHLKGAIATLILAFSPLLVHAEDQGDLRSQHPDARNDRPSEMMRDRVPAVRAKQHGMVKQPRMVKQHRKTVRDQTTR